MTTPKYKFKKGDKVRVIAGRNRFVASAQENSDKPSEGVILQILPSKGKAIVEGVNIIKKHVKPTNESQGGIIEVEAPIQLSNLALLDPKEGVITKIGRKEHNGKIVRYAKKSQTILD